MTFPHLEFDQLNSLPFVSDGVRDMIEALEPAVHQFLPVEVTGRDYVARRHILIVCNRLDTLHPTLTFPRNERGFYDGVIGKPHAIVHRANAIAGYHLWHEKYAQGLFASDELVGRMLVTETSGLFVSDRHEAV
ncbi:MAG: hypothetical protein Q8M85_05890 [Tabrizicola sp.]|nr:DUF1629 domain-containing protein [Tabrizicola sp.]MDP3194778.1 hypothetical protein [Tabrizicola sp.]